MNTAAIDDWSPLLTCGLQPNRHISQTHMVQFHTSSSTKDSNTQQTPHETESDAFKRQIGEVVMTHLSGAQSVRVWYADGMIQVAESGQSSERANPVTESSPSSDRETERKAENIEIASSHLADSQAGDRESSLSADSAISGHESNGLSNVQNLTEKQAKAFLLLEQTNGDISISELAERAGYSSKGGAHSAKEKWRDSRA